jgi:hypothetical protein
MFDLVLCHRRNRDVAIGAVRDHWRGARTSMISELRSTLGFEHYVQVHRASRLNGLYLGIRGTRSWPLAAMFSAGQGLSLPPLKGRAGAFDEMWDVIEAFRYRSPTAMIEALTTNAAIAGLQRLSGDARTLVRHSTAVPVEVLSLYEEPGLAWPRTVTILCLRARPPLTRETMQERWRTTHRQLMADVRAALVYRHYEQLHARTLKELGPVVAALGVTVGDFDGIAWIGYANER